MTPLLVLVFGINPSTAVGTDLLYAAITKASGVWVHHQKRHIDWQVTGWLALGSVPAAGITLIALQFFIQKNPAFESALKTSVGIALILTALAILWRATRQGLWSFLGGKDEVTPIAPDEAPPPHPVIPTVLVGIALGVLVTLSSIGAGAIGTVALVFLYPHFPITRIVGTDIAHAVPLTLVAGLGHLVLGHVNTSLLIHLLLGSIPGIWLGSHLSARISEKWSRPLLAALLITIAIKMIH
jgi:uncharacterized membrane protein YfcA